MTWFKCSDGCPSKKERVLTVTDYGIINIDFFDDEENQWVGHVFYMRGGKVVAWKRLPEYPAELMVETTPRPKKK